jgi:uncharacterized protein (TIGR02284 family)
MSTDTTTDLNKLIEINLDGHAGYQQAAEHANDTTLKQNLAQYALQRKAFSEELQQAVRANGGDPTDSGSAAGAVHRAWIGIKDAVTSGDTGILNECIRGEESAVKNYQEVLGDNDLPAGYRDVAQRQLAEIERALADMRALKARFN